METEQPKIINNFPKKEPLERLPKHLSSESEKGNESFESQEEPNIVQDEEVKNELEKKFGGFVSGRRKFYSDIGANSLEEARRERESAIEEFEYYKNLNEKHKTEIERLKTEINNLKSVIINRILEFRKINELRKQLKFKEYEARSYRESLYFKKEFVEAYDHLLSEEKKLADLMEEAYKENAAFDEKKSAELLKDEKNRDVKTLIKKHNVFFVHDIVVADWKPSENNRAINTKNLNFEDQLNIIMGLEPTLSVSTLSSNSKNRTFGNGSWGVLFSGGRIIGGGAQDEATVATGLRNRKIEKGLQTIEAIDKAIIRPRIGGKSGKIESESYNELVMEKPEIAGIYFKWGADFPKITEGKDIFLLNDQRSGYDRWWERIQEAMKSGAPIFVIESDNNVRLVYDIDIKNRYFRVTPIYDPENLIDMPGVYKQHTGEEEKKKAVMRVFNKAAGLIPADERRKYMPDGTENKTRGLYNVY